MPRCPHCDQLLFTAETRCPHCDQGLRETFSVDDLVEAECEADPRLAESLELTNRLHEIAPLVSRWQMLDEPRGPMPDVHPRHREEVAAILARMGELACEFGR